MNVLPLSPNPVEGHRFSSLLGKSALCAEIVAAVAEAIQDTRDQMHAELSPAIKGMHTHSHVMSNLGYATQEHGGRLVMVNGQQRVRLTDADGLGALDLALAKGVPGEDGFDVSEKGAATEQLIGIRAQSLDLDVPGVPVDAGAFIVHHLVRNPDDPQRFDVMVYLADPARMNEKRTYLYCDECVLLGRRTLARRDQGVLFAVEPATVTPQVAVRPR